MRVAVVSVFNWQRSTSASRPKGCCSIYTCADHFFKRRISSCFFLEIMSPIIRRKLSPRDKPECIYLFTSSLPQVEFELGLIYRMAASRFWVSWRDANLPTVSLDDNAYLYIEHNPGSWNPMSVESKRRETMGWVHTVTSLWSIFVRPCRVFACRASRISFNTDRIFSGFWKLSGALSGAKHPL